MALDFVCRGEEAKKKQPHAVGSIVVFSSWNLVGLLPFSAFTCSFLCHCWVRSCPLLLVHTLFNRGRREFIQLAHKQFTACSTIPYNLRFWRAKAIGKLSCTWAELEQVKLGPEITWFSLLCATPFRSIFKAIFLAVPRPTSHESIVSFALIFALQTTKLSSKIWNFV
jgi:hypothetical protein